MGFYGSYSALIFLPLTIIILASNLATLFRYLMYKLIPEEKKTKAVISADDQPVLVLEFNKTSLFISWLLVMPFIALSVHAFFFADHIAYKSTYVNDRSIFFLTREQTYVFYYVAWKFISLVVLFCFCAVSIITLNRKVIFYNNAVVVENLITGRRELQLDENVKRNDAGSGGRGIWIYDERKGINLKVYSKTCMELTRKQEKLLTEIMSRIPKKTKIFMII